MPVDKAAVLAVRVARNHPLPDDNKRLAWGCLTMFCILSRRDLHVDTDDAVHLMLVVASGEVDEPGSGWPFASRIAVEVAGD
jgi:death on curing protein